MRGSAYVKDLKIGSEHPVRIMGVLNVSPESFYKLSVRTSPEEIAAAAVSMTEKGADIIDIGAMSTAPYLESWISEEKEAERMAMAVKAVRGSVSVPISADTFRPRPAEVALRLGVDMINDVSGLRHSPDIARLVADYDASLLVMANDARSGDIIETTTLMLRESLSRAIHAGVREDRIIIDPGIGFHRKHEKLRWYEADAELIRRLPELRKLGRPICIGVSRKSFIGRATGHAEPAERLFGSVAAEAIAVMVGADIIRTHNVAETLDAVRTASLIAGRQLRR